MFHFAPTASGLVTEHHRKQPGSVFFRTCLQIIVHIKEIPYWVFSFPGWTSQLSQLLLVRPTLLPLIISGPLSLPPSNTCPALRNAELDTAYSRCSLTCAESKGKILPWPTGNTPPGAEDSTSCLCHRNTFLTRDQLGSHHNPQSF